MSQVDGKKDDEGSLYNAIRPFCGRMLKLAFKRQMSNVKISEHLEWKAKNFDNI